MARTSQVRIASALMSLVLISPALAFLGLSPKAEAFGVLGPVPGIRVKSNIGLRPGKSRSKRSAAIGGKLAGRTQLSGKKAKQKSQSKTSAAKVSSAPYVPPQDLVSLLKSRTIRPGVIHKSYNGSVRINVLDVDMVNAPVHLRPVLAGETFNRLADVKQHSRKVNAVAAVNANYFKKDGTPLGTLIIDGEWISGPLFDRVAMGINSAGFVRIDRVNMHGELLTSNTKASSIWVNNINQPRRKGAKLIVYNRRWGTTVKLPYTGCLVAIDAGGKIIATHNRSIAIPYNGYVLSDLPGSAISNLKVGDLTHLSWHTDPDTWGDVVQAVSGGPLLIKNGEIHFDLQGEHFRPNWTGSQIQARTACGVTADNHLLMITVEGRHTLWDVAKLLAKLGAVEAMNLDGGGSTTMVVAGNTVTRNANAAQRRVASSLAIVEQDPKACFGIVDTQQSPQADLGNFVSPLSNIPSIWDSASFEVIYAAPPQAAEGQSQGSGNQETAASEADKIIQTGVLQSDSGLSISGSKPSVKDGNSSEDAG